MPSARRKPAADQRAAFLEWAIPWVHQASMDEALDLYAELFDVARPDPVLQRAFARHDRFFLLTHLLRRPDAIHPWLYARIREVEANPDGHLDLWSREHYKLQRLDEPTPTPDGWKLHGDLVVGDRVFGPDGAICHVVALNAIVHDAECYEIEFDDGFTIQAGAEHLWPIERRTCKRIPGAYKTDGPQRRYRETVIMQTREIAAHPHEPNDRLAIRVNDPLDLPEAELPIDPYVLGAWLGDGSSADGRITGIDEGIFDEIARRGFVVGAPTGKCGVTRTIYGLCARLRSAGVLGKKRIPAAYLRASFAQRLALMQGLMDTDGHCNTRGTATFVNVNDGLVDDLCELAHTLGLKPRRRRHTGIYNGQPRDFWQVSFQSYQALPVFRLARKLSRCKTGARPHPRRFIVSCRKVPTVPMRCIQVSHPDGLYLTGRSMVTTHNSTVITFAGAIQEILRDPEITIAIFSHTKPTATKFAEQIRLEFEQNEPLQRLFPDILYREPRRESPRWTVEKGFVVKRHGNPKEATVEAHGLVDGQPTGSHFKLRIYDDTVTLESVGTPEQIEKTTTAWALSHNLGARGIDGMTRMWHAGTRYHFADSYHTMIEMGAVKPRVYPATHDGTLDGRPVFLSEAAWAEKKRTQTLPVLAAQMLLNPAAGSEATFRREWLRFLDIRPGTLNVYILVDPASSRKKGSDYTAMVVVGVDAQGNLYLLDGHRDKMSLAERWHALRALRRHWMRQPGVQQVRVGYERYGMQSDIEHFEIEMERDREAFEVVELAWPREGPHAKNDRIQRLEPYFRNGRFYLAAVAKDETSGHRRMREAGQPWRIWTPTRRRDHQGNVYSLNKEFLTEYLAHPFSVHDDLLDAASRIFDIDMAPPIIVDETALVPAYAD